MNDKQSPIVSEPPVPVRDHFRIMKRIQGEIENELERVNGARDTEWQLVGIRLGYDTSQPDLPDPDLSYGPVYRPEYPLYCGYMQPLANEIKKVRVETEEEWLEIVEKGQEANPLSIEFVDSLYYQAQADLRDAAPGEELWVGWLAVLVGSDPIYQGSECSCWPGRRRYYYVDDDIGEIVDYCTIVDCG